MQLIAVLHNIRSVHNTGSIFRTADGAGFRKIYLCGITPAPLDRFGRIRRDFAKVSLGAEKYLKWEYKKSATALIKKLKSERWEIYALEQASGAVLYNSVILTPHLMRGKNLPREKSLQKIPRRARNDKIALVLGNEIGGLSKPILALADKILEIPMHGRKESLNVAVAFGIAAYKLAENSRSG